MVKMTNLKYKRFLTM